MKNLKIFRRISKTLSNLGVDDTVWRGFRLGQGLKDGREQLRKRYRKQALRS